MELLKTLIVDDEDFCRKNLAEVLKESCPEIEVIGYAKDSKELLKEIQQKSPDLVFLDIEMPGKDGLETITTIKNRKFSVIVVTGKKEYGIRAIKENVLDYILKPLDEEEVRASVDKAVARHLDSHNNRQKDKVLFHIHSGFKVLKLEEIIFLEGKDNYTEVYFGEESLLVSKTLKEYDTLLNQQNFFRLQKKFLVNLKHVEEFSYKDGGYVIMSNGRQLSIPRLRLKDFVNRMKHYAMSTHNN